MIKMYICNNKHVKLCIWSIELSSLICQKQFCYYAPYIIYKFYLSTINFKSHDSDLLPLMSHKREIIVNWGVIMCYEAYLS